MDELINSLQQLGVSRREAEVYIALMQKKFFTASEVSKITTITRSKSYDVLNNLVKKGLCTVVNKNNSKEYSCVKPAIALQNIIKQQEDLLNKKKDFANQFEKKLNTLYKKKADISDPLDFVELVTDPGQIQKRYLEIQAGTKKEFLIFTKPPYNGMLDDNLESQEDALKNNIQYKSIYECKEVKTKKDRKYFVDVIEKYISIGEQARIAEELHMKLVVSDGAIAIFSLKDRFSLQETLTTMIVNHPSLAMTLKEVFDTYWEKSMTIEEYKKKYL